MSNHDRLLVIDEGTTGTRALVFDGAGRRLGASYAEFTQYHPAPDRVEHDAEEIWQRSLERIGEALEESATAPAALSAVGITNQRGTSLLWDRESGVAVTRAIVWQDLRTSGLAAEFAAEWGARVQSRTGWTIAPVYSCLSLHWLLAHDRNLRARAEAGELAFGTMDSWLIHKLSGGAEHVISASNAVVTGCYDLLADDWYGEWLEALDIPRAVLPQIVDDSGVITTTNAEVLGAEVPIAAAIADQSAALFGQGCLESGQGKTTHGTGTFLDLNTGETPVISENGLSTIVAWRREGVTTYGLEGYAPVTGAAIQWLRDGAGLLQTAGETEDLARTVDDNGGVYFVPALTGLAAPTWDSTARGLLIGISPGTSRAHLVRAALEGIVYSVKDFTDLMAAESGRPITSLRADGGASANDFLLQFQADMLDATIHRPGDIEATAVGAAYLAGLAVGVWERPEDCFCDTADDAVFVPEMDAATRQSHHDAWTRAVERARGWAGA